MIFFFKLRWTFSPSTAVVKLSPVYGPFFIIF